MVKRLFCVCLLGIFSQIPLSAEPQFLNIYGNLGYGFGMGGYYIGSSDTYHGNNDPIETKDHFLNLGHGFKMEVGSGIMILPFLETRISFDLTLGAPSPEIRSRRTNEIVEDTVIDYSYSSRGLRVIFAPYFELIDNVEMYLGVGMVFNSVRSKQEITITISEPEILRTAEIVQEIPLAIGFTGVAGIEFPIAESISFMGEIRFEQMNHKLQREQVESLFNFPDIRTISYEQDDTERNPPPNIPGSNWGIRLGLKLWLL
ncbi:hypothetical protein CHISP_1413 [Chitinispirillum alkaliphilum]|nr:hypothetical protein CHISP_1413 [Chitinispirillum alkaliphilum]